MRHTIAPFVFIVAAFLLAGCETEGLLFSTPKIVDGEWLATEPHWFKVDTEYHVRVWADPADNDNYEFGGQIGSIPPGDVFLASRILGDFKFGGGGDWYSLKKDGQVVGYIFWDLSYMLFRYATSTQIRETETRLKRETARKREAEAAEKREAEAAKKREAKEAVEKAERIKDGREKILQFREAADKSFRAGNLEEALDLFKKCSSTLAGVTEVREAHQYCDRRMREIREAKEAVEKAERIKNGREQISQLRQAADKSFRAGNLGKALDLFDRCSSTLAGFTEVEEDHQYCDRRVRELQEIHSTIAAYQADPAEILTSPPGTLEKIIHFLDDVTICKMSEFKKPSFLLEEISARYLQCQNLLKLHEERSGG